MNSGEGGKYCSFADGQKVADDLKLQAFFESSALKDKEAIIYTYMQPFIFP